MKNNFQKIILLISTALLLFLCFAFVFLYREISDNYQKIQQDTINLQAEEHQRHNIASLNQSLQKIAPDMALLESHFVKSSNIVPFLNMIETLAQEAGVSVQINSINIKKDNSELMVDLKASGSFELIYKFLTLLENFPHELDFISMNMQKSLSDVSGKNIKDSKWEVILKAQLLSLIP